MINDLKTYPTFNDFFTRLVKPRNIPADERLLLSPADSIIISLSEVKGDENMLIKGFTYKMGELLTGIKN
jgi:phosphatidylserine decarboxylase